MALFFRENQLLKLVAVGSLALTGCATPLPDTPDSPQTASSDQSAVSAQIIVESKPDETPIPSQSLMPLLQAEFALRARDYDQGLTLLTEQAQALDDPALARRALRLAEFVSDGERAAILAVRLVELAPEDTAAVAAAVAWLTRTGQPLKAMAFAEIAYRMRQPVNVAATLGAYEQMDSESQALLGEKIRDMAAQWPEDDELAIAASLLARLEKDLPAAAESLAPVINRTPDNLRAILLWTQIMLDQKASDPLKLLRDSVDAYPANQELRLQYARLLGSERDYAGAQAQFDILLSNDPNNPELLGTAALLDFELEFFEAAMKKFQQLIAVGERLDEAYYYIGRIEMSRDRYAEAIEAFGSVGPSREFRDAKAKAAELLADTAFARDIRTFFDEQRRDYPGNAEQLFLLEAEALSDWEGEALKAYDRGLIAFPQSFALLYGRAMAHEAGGALTAMEDDLRSILAQDPNHAATLNALGYTLTNHTQRYEEAADLIERAMALSPGDPAILDSLGWVYYKLGQYAQSEALLRQAHQAFPDPEVAAHLGEVLWIQGKQIEARDIWRDGLNRVPDHTIILEAVERLGADLR